MDSRARRASQHLGTSGSKGTPQGEKSSEGGRQRRVIWAGPLMTKREFDEIEIAEVHETPAITVTEWHVMGFAAISMDYFELHTNDEYARKTQFGRRVAHGLLGLALADGLKHRSSFQIDAIASLHWSWNFSGPIFLGDTIRARLEVIRKVPSRTKPDRGVVTVKYEVLNQSDEVLQHGTNKVMVRRGAS